jgi:hypothetical protein
MIVLGQRSETTRWLYIVVSRGAHRGSSLPVKAHLIDQCIRVIIWYLWMSVSESGIL